MSKIVNLAEKYIWNNFKMYLMQYSTCLLDNLLIVQNPDSDFPPDRYKDFFNELEKHIGLASYTIQQPAVFSNLPYITVNVQPIDLGDCNTRCIVAFDVVFATDTPGVGQTAIGADDSTRYVGNSNESVASFRANIANSLEELFFHAFDPAQPDTEFYRQAFFDRLRDQTLANPTDTATTAPWMYNIKGSVDGGVDMTAVTQLKREDRNSGLSVFHITYQLDLNCLYGDENCGCC